MWYLRSSCFALGLASVIRHGSSVMGFFPDDPCLLTDDGRQAPGKVKPTGVPKYFCTGTYLLPRLLSGEVEVEAAEETVEDAV